MKADELREKYLTFFQTKDHVRCPSDVLVPTWDPSVLFTPAGMNQFKDHFLGKVRLEFTRATTAQKCLRTGDIENVGRTAYHHTFFEMLGNFSFGDYFKREAIHWAWQFLTDRKWLGLDPERLSVSVYLDDEEAARIWQTEVGLPPTRIERMGEDDNFWPAGAPSHGPDGVCGPCSEIFYHPATGAAVEIWNLVFTQFNRVGDPPGNLRPLPSRNIDTGMGLERTASVLQGVDSNFHIDLLLPMVMAAAETCRVPYEPKTENGRRLRRITDHVRACVMAIHENVYPGPNKEKYVIRRLLRRAVLDGHQMGVDQPFLHRLVPAVVQQMKTGYPELLETVSRVADAIQSEETSFFSTIDAGLARIEKIFREMTRAGRVTVDGDEAAELYQTYGVPPELFESMAAEQNLAFDWEGFRRAMERHGEASGKVVHTVMGDTGPIGALKKALHETPFLGYEMTECQAQIRGIVAQNKLCDQVEDVGHQKPLTVVLDRSPFYGESGGQVGDTGQLTGQEFTFQVTDTQKDGALLLHHGHLTRGRMASADEVTARVDSKRRRGIQRAHSATHLLHHALQQVLGKHAQQQGSKVDEDWLRFDFSHQSALTGQELARVERIVGERIADDEAIQWQIVPLAEARKQGAMMLFGEKYPDPVRLVSMGSFSRELCGGTHLERTGQILAFEVVSEEAISAGTRRITALTGEKARQHADQTRQCLKQAAALLQCDLADVPLKARDLVDSVRNLKKQLAGGAVRSTGRPAADSQGRSPSTAEVDIPYSEVRDALGATARIVNVSPFEVPSRIKSLISERTDLVQGLTARATAGLISPEQLLESAKTIAGIHVIAAEAAGAGPGVMRQWIDEIRRKAPPAAVMLACRDESDKVTLVAGLSRDVVDQGLSAVEWVRHVARLVDGGGGGRADLAQAGGKLPQRLPDALAEALRIFEHWVREPSKR
jgi:alanyl-tRNA synthetase